MVNVYKKDLEKELSIDDVLSFIDEQDKWLNNKYPVSGRSEQAYARMTKVAEEVGEMASALGCAFGNQREEKLLESQVDDLGLEMADVVFTTFMLAKTMGVDMKKALEAKIKKINQRQKREL